MMCKMLFKFALVAGLAAGSAQASVVNGDFETDPGVAGKKHGQSFSQLNSGPGSSWDTWDSLAGWQADGGYGIEVQSNRTLGSIDAYSGSHYVELDSDNNSSMYQDLTLDTGRYDLRFAYSPRTNDPATNIIDFGVSGLFSASVAGPSGTHAVGQWSLISYVFDVTTAGTYRLSFAASGTSDSYGGLLDAVSLRGPSDAPPPVPLPAPALLLGAALAGLGLLRRKSR